MFDSKKFNFDYLDFHCKELAHILINHAFDEIKDPVWLTRALNHEIVLDPALGDQYAAKYEAEIEAQRRAAWFKPFRVPLDYRMVILDCRNNDLFNGCLLVPKSRFSGRFEEFEILFDAGDEMTLADLARGLTLDDGTILKPEIAVGDVEALEERLAARIKSDCDDRLGEYFTWIVGGGPV